MRVPTLKELVSDNQMAEFQSCHGGYLWYEVQDVEFPVPLEETKGGCFLRTMRAITMMRWIRKHLAYLKESLEAPPDTRGWLRFRYVLDYPELLKF